MDQDKNKKRPRILLAITGSVAAVKGPELAVKLVRDLRADVRVLLTRGGFHFWNKAREYDPLHWDELEKLLCSNPEVSTEGTIFIHTADEEWKEWHRLGDPVMHVDLRDWADVAVLAPLSAHTLAKLANGLCDDALSCAIRAWDFGHGARPGKPLILAPAMNTSMWDHPLTQVQLKTIQGFWNTTTTCTQNEIYVVSPQVKELACGEVGAGALASVDDILQAVNKCCARRRLRFT